MRINTEKLSAVVAVIATTTILPMNPWTPIWYPPLTLAIGFAIYFTTNALLTCVEWRVESKP